MKFAFSAIVCFVASSTRGFSPTQRSLCTKKLNGYLDDLNTELNAPDANPDIEGDSKEATDMAKEHIDRYGPGDFSQFVDFEEFDGGDGQMGVAGDGKKGLDKEWEGGSEIFKSKSMSAKNAWGKSTGYADTLIEQGMESQKAQQLENWRNQQEVNNQRNQHRYLTEEFDNRQDDNWRDLSNFVGERIEETNLDEEFGAVQPGEITGVIELSGRLNQYQIHEFSLKNPFMGFSDFRARFAGMTNPGEWEVDPFEGSLNGRGDPTKFTVKFRPQSPAVSQGYLVVETEDDKWTYQLMGTGSM